MGQIIRKKGEKYKTRGLEIDVLVIHTAEPWLTSTEAQTWLEVANLDAHPSILAVYLLFDYEPGREVHHWPVISVYGEMPQDPNGG